MKRLMFFRVFCDLAFIATLILIFYPIEYVYVDPIFFLRIIGLTALACLLLTSVIAFLYVLISLGKIKLFSYKAQLVLFYAEFFILIGALLASTMFENDCLVINGALPFMIIFACCSFFLLRTLRDPDNRSSEKHNALSAASIMVVLLLCTNVVREAILRIPFLSVLNNKYRWDIKHSTGGSGGGPPPREQHSKDKITHLASGPDWEKIIVISIIAIISIALIILLIVRYRRVMKSRHRTLSAESQSLYDETRIFIKSGPKDLSAKRKAFGFRDYRGTVRACYAKFMRLCTAKAVEVKKCDTTKQINQKYGNKYPTEAADMLRNLYLKARYSDDAVGQQTAGQSIQTYKAIKKQMGQS